MLESGKMNPFSYYSGIEGHEGYTTTLYNIWRRLQILKCFALRSDCVDHEVNRSGRIAVGTSVTGRPPHRSVLEELPHTAPTSGDDAKPADTITVSRILSSKFKVYP